MDNAEIRPALYYPYIHIRSEQWLKATLLCAPAVTRIVPETYIPEDASHIAHYTRTIGPFGALLQAVPAYSQAADAAQHRLLSNLRRNKERVHSKFSRQPAPASDQYWIHDAKFTADLLRYLTENDLAWPSRGPAWGGPTEIGWLFIQHLAAQS